MLEAQSARADSMQDLLVLLEDKRRRRSTLNAVNRPPRPVFEAPPLLPDWERTSVTPKALKNDVF